MNLIPIVVIPVLVVLVIWLTRRFDAWYYAPSRRSPVGSVLGRGLNRLLAPSPCVVEREIARREMLQAIEESPERKFMREVPAACVEHATLLQTYPDTTDHENPHFGKVCWWFKFDNGQTVGVTNINVALMLARSGIESLAEYRERNKEE